MFFILGLDFGTKRVGAAIGDRDLAIASTLEVYERKDPAQDARHYQSLIREHDVARVVVGLPLRGGGSEDASARRARDWGAWLAGVTGRPVVFFDERYTSVEAEGLLRDAGVRAARRVGRRDMLAAQLLLQAYLDAGSPEAEAPPAPLEDR